MSEIGESGAPGDPGQGSPALILVAPPAPRSLTPAERQLRQMVVDAVAAPTSKAACGHALDQLFAFAGGRPLSRPLLNEWRSSMDGLAASTINVRLAAVRRLVAEARHAGMLNAEEAFPEKEMYLDQLSSRMVLWKIVTAIYDQALW